MAMTATIAVSQGAAQADDKMFDGIFLGAEVGLSNLKATIHSTEKTNDIYYGVAAGYRYQTDGGWLFGLEGNYGDDAGNLRTSSHTFNFNSNWRASLTAGKVFGGNENFLLYGKLGVGGIKVHPSTGGNDLTPINYEGMVAGAGIEYAASDRISWRFETSRIKYDPTFTQWQQKAGVIIKF